LRHLRTRLEDTAPFATSNDNDKQRRSSGRMTIFHTTCTKYAERDGEKHEIAPGVGGWPRTQDIIRSRKLDVR
jgi:hypothetical protein